MIGEPTRSRRAEYSLRDQNLRRERGQESEDTSIYKQSYTTKECFSRKRKRRGRAGRRAAQRQASIDRDRARNKELIIATHNVRIVAVEGKHGVDRAAEVLDVYQKMNYDMVDSQKPRRSGQFVLVQDECVMYCSGESGDDGEGKKDQGPVQRLGAGGDITYLSPYWEGTARK